VSLGIRTSSWASCPLASTRKPGLRNASIEGPVEEITGLASPSLRIPVGSFPQDQRRVRRGMAAAAFRHFMIYLLTVQAGDIGSSLPERGNPLRDPRKLITATSSRALTPR
jgi:hypothetical protein